MAKEPKTEKNAGKRNNIGLKQTEIYVWKTSAVIKTKRKRELKEKEKMQQLKKCKQANYNTQPITTAGTEWWRRWRVMSTNDVCNYNSFVNAKSFFQQFILLGMLSYLK